jgi:hypothetical protein
MRRLQRVAYTRREAVEVAVIGRVLTMILGVHLIATIRGLVKVDYDRRRGGPHDDAEARLLKPVRPARGRRATRR